jgi:hypothetical protein
LTARRPEPELPALYHQHGITPLRVPADPTTSTDTAWVDARPAPGRTTRLQALANDPSLTVLVRPDRVIASVATRCQPPLDGRRTGRRSAAAEGANCRGCGREWR